MDDIIILNILALGAYSLIAFLWCWTLIDSYREGMPVFAVGTYFLLLGIVYIALVMNIILRAKGRRIKKASSSSYHTEDSSRTILCPAQIQNVSL